MAQASDRVNLRLVELETGGELAVLPVPESHNLSAYQFSSDGRYLAAETIQGTVQLWDLRRLHTSLREIGLDWGPAEADGEPEQKGETKVEIGDATKQ